jgi:hypothetical protein
MNYFTGQKEFAFNKIQEFRALIPDAGVTVAVEFWNGTQWVTDKKSPVDSPSDIGCLGVKVRFTPTPSNGGYGFDSETGL